MRKVKCGCGAASVAECVMRVEGLWEEPLGLPTSFALGLQKHHGPVPRLKFLLCVSRINNVG